MKTSDLSPRLPSFHCLKEHVGGQWGVGVMVTVTKKATAILYPKIYLHHIKLLSRFPFFFALPFYSALLLICLLQVPLLHDCPISQKALYFSSSLLFCFFFLLLFPPGKSEHFSLTSVHSFLFCFFSPSLTCLMCAHEVCLPAIPACLSDCPLLRRLARLT